MAIPCAVHSQAVLDENTEAYDSAWKTVAAGPAYQRGNLHTWIWGKNRRAEWATPVRVPVLWLDTAFGGLKPYEQGGGNETRSLRLKSASGKEYALRSINKSRVEVVPKDFKGTFAEDIIQDLVSMAHPYGVTALPIMMEKAGINHPRGVIVWVPSQAALDTFNNKFKDDLYLLEQRPDGDWSEIDHLGNFEKFESTEDVVKKMLKDNKHVADQHAYVKARLFDMLVADWDRHEDNWRWGVKESGDTTLYIPIPRDRDNVFYSHDGFMVNFLVKAAKVTYMQHFDHNLKDAAALNWEMRHIDRFFTSALTQQDWLNAAHGLQQSLTDTVIAQSIRQMPPAIFKVSGNEIISKLKSRREKLDEFAAEYYRFLAKEVVLPGSNEREHFEIKDLEGGKKEVAVYRVDKEGKTETAPYYHRVFNPDETKEIRVFGLEGKDEFNVQKESKAIKVNTYDTTPNYEYKWYKYNYKGLGPDISYNNNDRLYVGLKYKATKNRWNKETFAAQYTLGARYSISQNAFNFYGGALYPSLIGKWDLSLYGEYDAIRWTNFYGAGNESVMITKDIEFHRLRSREWFANVGLSRGFKNSRFGINAFYQHVNNIQDTGRYVDKIFHFENSEVYEHNPYAGVQLTYSYTNLNDSIVPVKGFDIMTSGTLSNNFRQEEFFQKYEVNLRFFVPVTKHISFAVRGGGATVVNDAVLNSGQQYQHAIIGGGRSLRGYRRERFWGQTAYYNQNELRFITDLRTKLVSGKIGVFGFFDNGRVWMPGENSNKIHTAYGPGILFAPFKKIAATITYSISEESRLVQVRIDSKF